MHLQKHAACPRLTNGYGPLSLDAGIQQTTSATPDLHGSSSCHLQTSNCISI